MYRPGMRPLRVGKGVYVWGIYVIRYPLYFIPFGAVRLFNDLTLYIPISALSVGGGWTDGQMEGLFNMRMWMSMWMWICM